MLFRKALRACECRRSLICLEDGDDVMDYLESRGPFAEAPASTPALVLLDLNIPRVTGREVLRRIRSSAALRHLPVVVLTTSSDPDEVRECYELGANSFVTKPNTYEGLVEALRALKRFWCEVARLPLK